MAMITLWSHLSFLVRKGETSAATRTAAIAQDNTRATARMFLLGESPQTSHFSRMLHLVVFLVASHDAHRLSFRLQMRTSC